MFTPTTNVEGSATVLTKLKAALDADGDFPVRAKVVSELRKLVNDPNCPIEKIVEVILGEPSLGTRLLHLVNSVFYQRAMPIMTISQAVVQLGMRALTDLCTGLVLLRRFSPTAQRGGIFADNVKKSLLTSLLTSELARASGLDDDEERGYLAGMFFSIGPLLLAYYFPQVFEAAEQRAKRRKQTTTQSITETIGISPVALSIGIVDSLAIPEYYRDLLTGAYVQLVDEHASEPGRSYPKLAMELATAGRLADAIIDTDSRASFASSLAEIAKLSNFTTEKLDAVLLEVPHHFQQHCKMIEMGFLTLPDHFIGYVESRQNPGAELHEEAAGGGDEFTFFVDEIKEAINNRETMSSIIASVMEALAFGLKFDRVMLLFSDPAETGLHGKMALGQPFGVNPTTFCRKLNRDGDAPDSRAFFDGSVEVYGEPMFEGGWPFAAIPIGASGGSVGILYADMLEANAKDPQPLNEGALVGLNMLADLLDKALQLNSDE